MNRRLTWTLLATGAILCAVLAAPWGFLQSQKKSVSLLARPSEGPLSFVVFLSQLEDVRNPDSKSVFGWGGASLVSQGALQLGAEVNNCRQYKLSNDVPLRLEVKVDVKRPGFRVVGFLDGAEQNPALAKCVRDKMNSATLPSLSELRSVSEDLYRLVLEVHSNVAAPLSEFKE